MKNKMQPERTLRTTLLVLVANKLLAQKTITTIQAFSEMKNTRLSQYIALLRNMGWIIENVPAKNEATGKRFVIYTLKQAGEFPNEYNARLRKSRAQLDTERKQKEKFWLDAGMCYNEHEVQRNFFIELEARGIPERSVIHAIPNGSFRTKKTAARLKAEGVRAGVLDVFVPVARCGYHGLYIEFKYGTNKMTEEQNTFASRVQRQNYDVRIFYNGKTAANYLQQYLNNALPHIDVSQINMFKVTVPKDERDAK